MTEAQESIVEKIKKLLALATSPVPAEAEAAMAKAQELMIRYNISVADTHTKELSGYTKEDLRYDFMIDTRFICDILQRFFFVEIIRHPYNKTYSILGKKENVEVALYLRHHIAHQFLACWHNYKKVNKVRGVHGKKDYYIGLHRGLSAKLEAERTKLSTEQGLIVVADPKVKEFVASIYNKIKYTKAKQERIANGEAYHAGRADGEKIQLRAGLRPSTTNTQTALRLGK